MVQRVVERGRFSARPPEGDVVVFLIGMRFNRPLKVRSWLPVVRAMPRMQAELAAHPELGCLHTENWLGRTTISLQYWASVADLDRYARSTDHEHLPAWRAFNRAIGANGDVGIWHETFVVPSDRIETVYGNMPRFGLAAATQVGATRDVGETARLRLGLSDPDGPPVASMSEQ